MISFFLKFSGSRYNCIKVQNLETYFKNKQLLSDFFFVISAIYERNTNVSLSGQSVFHLDRRIFAAKVGHCLLTLTPHFYSISGIRFKVCSSLLETIIT